MSLFNKDKIIDLYRKYHKDILRINGFFDNFSCKFDGMYNREEYKIMWMFLREFKPKIILEIGAHKGWLTRHMCDALDGEDFIIHSFEIVPDFVGQLRGFAKEYNFEDKVKIYEGDVVELLEPNLSDLKGQVDFIFIDHQHTQELSKWCFDNLFDYVKKENSYIAIHDIHGPSNNIDEYRIIKFLKSKLVPDDFGETIEFYKWLVTNGKDYEKLLVTDLLLDNDYISSVKRYGGGDISAPKCIPRKIRKYMVNTNPTFWLKKRELGYNYFAK